MVNVYHAPISNALLESIDIPSAVLPGGTPVNGAGVDMRGWDGVAALIAVPSVAGGSYQAFLQMADDALFTLNVTTITDAGTGVICQTPAGTAVGLFWLEAYRPWRRFVRTQISPAGPPANTVTAGAYLLRYRHTGLYPVTARDSLGLSNRVAVRAA